MKQNILRFIVFIFFAGSGINAINQTFSEIDVGLSLFSAGEYCIGDYDNDGDFDLYFNGILFKNDNSNYVELNNNINKGKAKWLDIDNDSDIDLITVMLNNVFLNTTSKSR